MLRLIALLHRQELSVWADVATTPDNTSPAGALHAAKSTLQVADSVGQAAQQIVVAYKGLTAALEGFAGVQKQHQALQVSSYAVRWLCKPNSQWHSVVHIVYGNHELELPRTEFCLRLLQND